MDEDEELLTAEQAFEIVRQAGIQVSTMQTFRKWRARYGVYVVASIRRSELERAIRRATEPGPGRL